jgi:hypothetical protein
MRQAIDVVLSGSAAGNLTGAAFDVNQAVSASFNPYTADATAAGTFKVQCSADIITNNAAPTNWCDIPSATSVMAAGVAPTILIPNMAFKYVRVVFTRTAGSGTVNVNMNYISP